MEKQSIILLVDDNMINLQVLGSFLREKNYRSVVARSGKEALLTINKVVPDLILLDIMMPEMDGYQVCEILKSNSETRDIPVIFISALNETEDKIKGLDIGGVDFITKPFQKEEVFARIKAHITIADQRKELHQLNAMKDKFFSIIAHDLKGPIGSLKNLSEMLADSFDTFDENEKLDAIKEINKSSGNILELLENLLIWSRSQKGKMKFEKEKLNLYYIIDNVFSLLETTAKNKKIELFNNIPEDVSIVGDLNMLTTVARNLTSNALKFTDINGSIHVNYELINGYHNLTFKDNGTGMSESDKDKLFRIDIIHTSKGTKGEKGTGLGLILCKDFIEKHKGTIFVKSEIGIGTEITVEIPI